jgi:hypothetical protein
MKILCEFYFFLFFYITRSNQIKYNFESLCVVCYGTDGIYIYIRERKKRSIIYAQTE